MTECVKYCKDECGTSFVLDHRHFDFIFCMPSTDPERQFALLLRHMEAIRSKVHWMRSSITIYVEHNLGFEVCDVPSFLALSLVGHVLQWQDGSNHHVSKPLLSLLLFALLFSFFIFLLSF